MYNLGEKSFLYSFYLSEEKGRIDLILPSYSFSKSEKNEWLLNIYLLAVFTSITS